MTSTAADAQPAAVEPPAGSPFRRRRYALLAGAVLLGVAACVLAVIAGTDDGGSRKAAGVASVPVGRAVGDVDSSSVERRLLDDPDVQWVGTFDADPWDANWGFNWGKPWRAEATTVDGVSRHGRVLDVVFNPDNLDDREQHLARMGINRLAAFPLMGVPALEEAWFRYYVYLPADWEAAVDGKMPGLAGSMDVLDVPNATSGGGAYDPGSWSGRVMWNNEEADLVPSRPTPRTYLYAKSLGGRSIEDHRDPGNGRIYGFGEPWEDADGDRIYMRLGEWNMIEVHYKMNTPGVEDGVFEGWLYNSDYPDGVRGAYYDDVQYRDTAHADLAINQLQQAHYYGGRVGPTSEQHMYFDDFVISSAPIGPRREGS